MKISRFARIIFVVLLMLIVVGMVRTAAGFYQGSFGMLPALAIEPLSFLIGLGGGALLVGIPLLARAASHRGSRKIVGKEQCDDKNLESAARFGDKRPGVKVVKDMGSNVAGSPGSGDTSMVAGNPISGLSVKGGTNKPPAVTEKTAGNPVPGIGIIVKKCPGAPGCPKETE